MSDSSLQGGLKKPLQLFREGVQDPSNVSDDFWNDLIQFIEELEAQAEQIDAGEGKSQEEFPVTYSFRNTEKEFDTVKSLVKTLLENKEKARNDDKYIEWFIRTQVQNLDMNDLTQYRKGIATSTIRRVRRELQKEHEHLKPTDEETKKQRNQREKSIRSRYGNNKQKA